MPISIQCTGCAKKLNVPDNAVGKRVRCPACSAVIVVPLPEEELVEPDDLVEPEAEEGYTEEPPPIKPKAAWEKDAIKAKDDDDNGGGEYGLDENDDEEEDRRRRKKKRKRRYEEVDDDFGRGRGRRGAPNRGVVILVLGILAIFATGCICPPVGWIMAGIALNMASGDIQQIDQGLMEKNGRGLIVGGQACSYIAILVGTLIWAAGAAMVGNRGFR